MLLCSCTWLWVSTSISVVVICLNPSPSGTGSQCTGKAMLPSSGAPWESGGIDATRTAGAECGLGRLASISRKEEPSPSSKNCPGQMHTYTEKTSRASCGPDPWLRWPFTQWLTDNLLFLFNIIWNSLNHCKFGNYSHCPFLFFNLLLPSIQGLVINVTFISAS